MKFRSRGATVLALVFLSPAAVAEPLAADDKCSLSESIKVIVKQDGANAWTTLDKGTELKVKERADDWTKVAILPRGKRAKASTAQLEERCAVTTKAAPAPEPAAAPEAETPTAAVEEKTDAPSPEAAPEGEAASGDGDGAPADDPTATSGEASDETTAESAAPADEAAATEAADEPPAPVVDEPAPPVPSKAPTISAGDKDPSLPLVAVLELRHDKADKGLANALATVITSEVSSRPDMRVVSRSELQAVVAHQAEQALLGCESVKCATDVASLVEADLVVTGGIERAGGAFVFSLTLIDPVAGAVKERVEATWRSDPEEIVLLARPYVDRLFGGQNAASYVGALEVLAPEGAQVFLDGKEVGKAPLAHAVTDLPIGVHALEVAQAGFVTDKRDVVILRGETTVTRVELEEEPLWTQWWFWTAVGGGTAVALAAGATVGTVAILAAAEPPPTTVGVKSPLPAAVQ